jgi:hypothetical protein
MPGRHSAGTSGAIVRGGPAQERLDLNIDTLWPGAPRVAKVEDLSAVLGELRDAVINRRLSLRAKRGAVQREGGRT